MTIQKAKEQALFEWGYETLQQAFENGVLYENVVSTAMHIYARSKWEEALNSCNLEVRSYNVHGEYESDEIGKEVLITDPNKYIGITKPEFKV
jgi:hypothetical protein